MTTEICILIITIIIILSATIMAMKTEAIEDRLRGCINNLADILFSAIDKNEKSKFAFTELSNKFEKSIQSLEAQNSLLTEQNEILCKLVCGYENPATEDAVQRCSRLSYYRDKDRLLKQENMQSDFLKNFRKWTVEDFDTYVRLINQCPKGLRTQYDTDKILSHSDKWKQDFIKLNNDAAATRLCMLQFDCEECDNFQECRSKILEKLKNSK